MLDLKKTEHPSLKRLTAVVLAGGLGTRLRPVVEDRAKVMAIVAGRPFLTYVLDQIVRAGIKRVILCTGHLADSISSTLNHDYQGLQLMYSHEKTPLGTGGALKQVARFEDPFPMLVFNGDSFVNIHLEQLLEFHWTHRSAITLALATKQCSGSFGLVELGEGGVVKRFSEKEATGKSEWVNAGVYLLEQQVIESIPEGQYASFEREILPQWVGNGLYGYAQGEEVFDIGTPSSFSDAQRVFAKYDFPSLTYS